LLTIPWAIWHIPTFWLDTGLRGFPLPLVPAFFISMTAGAVVLGWLYERARSSIFVVALFHASINIASATVGTAAVAPATSIAVVALAVLILRADARATSRARDTIP
jgi:membrane protease YdiL (CAAX protease family)